ncbi:MAG: MFS transporter [Chloroflexi bacterium]|nr:MFS transporter [Chloroflexota bacterium]
MDGRAGSSIVLGVRENWRQIALLVAINAFVGGMIGMERSIVPLLGETEFGISSTTAAVSFIATFGFAKAITNLFAGVLSDRLTRRKVLMAGWLIGIPVPLVLIWAPSWGWVIGANLLLGINQGLAWSMTVNMKMDMAGPKKRGFVLGLNEAAGYVAVAAMAYLTGVIAEQYGLRPEPFYLGVALAAGGLALTALVRDTRPFVAMEADGHLSKSRPSSLARTFANVTWREPRLYGASQAGFVNNLNDGLAWGIFPLFFFSRGLDLERIGILAAAYPFVWGVLQLGTGWASDIVGRRPAVVGGLLLQAVAISLVAMGDSFNTWLVAVVLLGVGTALVYPTLIAAISDEVHPEERATSVGVYRFWRDGGFVAGALGAGALADLLGFQQAIHAVAALTAASAIIAAATLSRSRPASAPPPTEVLT